SENERIRQIADTLFKDETNLSSLIKKALSFTHDYLVFDDSLARQIDAGTCRTLDVQRILDTRKGTCSEYANLFIALMRYKKIPARFCVGYIYDPDYKAEGTHAWPECYIDGVGWFAVDPTINSLGFPHFMAIKMRHGLDYEDCDIRTLGQDIEPIKIEKSTYSAPLL
ncbi:MAG: transglutaminase-like domain-containing protein, partial [Rikenellaceae bacterium]|nr:transglutaminase-like domain-containing protein [Rikenellaceae bacterium]